MQSHNIVGPGAMVTVYAILSAVSAAPQWNDDSHIESVVGIPEQLSDSAPLSSFETTMADKAEAMMHTKGMSSSVVEQVIVTVTTIDTTIGKAVSVQLDVVNDDRNAAAVVLSSDKCPDNGKVLFRRTDSTSSIASNNGTTSSVTTVMTITLATSSYTSSSSSASSFDVGQCDDLFCNENGDEVCIYWAGFTSYDVSRGPIPGEIPTVLGPCPTEWAPATTSG